MTDPTALRVAIIGCGNIAGGFDLANPPGAPKLTHAGAYADDRRFRIEVCVDPIDERRSALREKWQIPSAFASVDALRGQTFDVISICSPTQSHPADLAAAIALKPRLIFCEKPIAPTLAAAEEAVDACERAGIVLAVNHTRRWSPDVRRLRAELAAGVWGRLRSVSCLYNKGIFNNGAHMIDLLLYLLGDLDIAWAGRPVHDFWDDDPSIPAALTTRSGAPVTINIANAADYALFECQIVTDHALIAMEDGGMRWRKRRLKESGPFAGYRSLDHGEMEDGTYPQAMRNAIAEIYGAVVHGAALPSTGRSALVALAYCDQLKTMALANASAPDTRGR